MYEMRKEGECWVKIRKVKRLIRTHSGNGKRRIIVNERIERYSKTNLGEWMKTRKEGGCWIRENIGQNDLEEIKRAIKNQKSTTEGGQNGD